VAALPSGGEEHTQFLYSLASNCKSRPTRQYKPFLVRKTPMVNGDLLNGNGGCEVPNKPVEVHAEWFPLTTWQGTTSLLGIG
jgi:hypothetical protein